MLTTYAIPLLAVVALCAFWAVFQTWLFKYDPDAEHRSLKCGGCGSQRQCSSGGECRKGGHS